MKFKAGDTFDYSGEVDMVDGAGDPVDMTNWIVGSRVRFPDASRVVDLTAEWIGGGFTHVRLHHSATDDWPPGPADIDVEFTAPGGTIISTETVRFTVLEDLS